MDGRKAKQAAFVAVLRKLKEGQKLTAADYRLLDEMEAAEKRDKVTSQNPSAGEEEDPGDPNGGATLEEDLEEWTLRDGIVRGAPRRLRSLAASHQVERKELDKTLWRIQRRILAQYGWEGSRRSGPLTGPEALALLCAKSIYQSSRTFQLWSLMMEEAERLGAHLPMEQFTGLVQTLKQLQERRDGLVLKIRDLSAKEKRAGTGRNQKATEIRVVMSPDT